MNNTAIIHNVPSHSSNECPRCGRRFRWPKATPDNPDRLRKYMEKRCRQNIERDLEATTRQERNQRLIDRADYLDVIPLHKQASPLSVADELKYQFLGQLEKLKNANPEERKRMSQPYVLEEVRGNNADEPVL